MKKILAVLFFVLWFVPWLIVAEIGRFVMIFAVFMFRGLKVARELFNETR